MLYLRLAYRLLGLVLCTCIGLAAAPCRAQEPPRVFLYPELLQGLYVYANHPNRDLASATTGRIAVWLYEHWLIGATYRFTYLHGKAATDAAWQQHDVYSVAGYAERRFGLTLHYAMIHGALNAAENYADTSHHLGLSARYSPFGDGVFTFATSLYGTTPVLRGELSWRFPLWRGISLKPAFALQWSADGFLPNGGLTARYDHTRFGVFAGGKYGWEKKPAYLMYEFIYNGPDRINYGLWAGVYGRPRAGWTLSLTYALDHLVSDAATSSATALSYDAHYLTAGVSKEF